MDEWTTVFGSYTYSGVYSITEDTKNSDIKKAAAACKLDFSLINLTSVRDKASFLKKVAEALSFPEYFGMNWDALSDCLTDMGWRPAAGYVLLLTNFQKFAGVAPADMKVLRDIFDSSARYWKQKSVPFYIILSGKSPQSSDQINLPHQELAQY
jgi:RNAse (barnase) inhibitor barstar